MDQSEGEVVVIEKKRELAPHMSVASSGSDEWPTIQAQDPPEAPQAVLDQQALEEEALHCPVLPAAQMGKRKQKGKKLAKAKAKAQAKSKGCA
eukprot:2659235-Alexandrium_andersonii.AAC.1